MAEPITTTSATVILPSPFQFLGAVFTIVLGWKISEAVIDLVAESASKAINKASEEMKEKIAAHKLKKDEAEKVSIPEVPPIEKVIPTSEGTSKTLAEKLSFWKKPESPADTVTAEELVETAVATS